MKNRIFEIALSLVLFGHCLNGDETEKQAEVQTKTLVPHQIKWDQLIEKAKKASTVSYRGLCLYDDHITDIECRGGEKEVEALVDYMVKQKFVDSVIDERVPLDVGVGGIAKFYDRDGKEVGQFYYMNNDLCLDLDEKSRIFFLANGTDDSPFCLENPMIPFNFFGKIVESGGWKELKVRRKMKNIHEYRKSKCYELTEEISSQGK
jgi:hypothetical protein